MARSDVRRKSRRRVLLIAPQPFYEPRGTPMNVLQMCRALTRAGYRVDLATYPLGQDVDVPGLTICRAPRVPGIRSVPIGFSKRKLLLDASLALLILRLVLRSRYDVIHAVEEAVFLALPLTWLGIPLIHDLDSQISHQLEYTGVVKSHLGLACIRQLERLALARSSAAITVCRALTESARALDTRTPIFQVEDSPLEESSRDPNPAAVESLRDEFGLHDRRVVVYTGNLEAYQGVELLLEAAPLLRERVRDAAILLVGGDRMQVEAFRTRIRDRGLQETVIATGLRPPNEMPDWMALGEVLVSPRTLGENTPLKIYTYMRSGKPIVATALETHTQVLDESSAVLCDPCPAELAEALARVIENPSRYTEIAATARARVEREFSFDAFQRKLLAAYDAIGLAPSK